MALASPERRFAKTALRSRILGAYDGLSTEMTPKFEERRWLVLFTKEPAPGRVKTRLGKEIGMDLSASLARSLLADSLAVAAAAAHTARASLVVAYAPDEISDIFRAELEEQFPGVRLIPQGEGGLGNRLAGVLDQLKGSRVALGSDAPDLPQSLVVDAFAALGKAAAVLGPTTDGGYYLIGFATDSSAECLRSNIRWSVAETLSDTVEVLGQAGLGKPTLLQSHQDVDDLPALRRLALRVGGAPNTRAWMKDHPEVFNPA